MLLKRPERCGFRSPVSSSAWGTAPARLPTPHTPSLLFEDQEGWKTHQRHWNDIMPLFPQSNDSSNLPGGRKPTSSSLLCLRAWTTLDDPIPEYPIRQWVFEDADLVWTTQISPHALAGQLNREQPYMALQSPGTCTSPCQTHSLNSELNFTNRLLITDFLIKRQQTRH